MSGHSHWATIKRAKGAADAKKGKIFSKLGKEITIVVKAKGGDPNTNPTLRTLIAKAKAAQMPNDNIDRAIKKGTGELESAALVDATYEGIKGGIAIVVNVLTDNKNRAAAEVGNVFKKNGTEFAKQGSAGRLFDRMGQIMIPAADGVDEDKVTEVALDVGAEDVIRGRHHRRRRLHGQVPAERLHHRPRRHQGRRHRRGRGELLRGPRAEHDRARERRRRGQSHQQVRRHARRPRGRPGRLHEHGDDRRS